MKVRGTFVFATSLFISAITVSISNFSKSTERNCFDLQQRENRQRRICPRRQLTAAHRTLPFGTRVLVTNVSSGRSVVVRINDRGPYIAGRIIDLTPAGAKAIGSNGLARVTLTVLQSVGDSRSGRPNS